jgi:hypothetical protein
MCRAHFEFEIGHSFVTYDSHPITVPRGEVDYKQLESERLHQGKFVLVFPKGERATARMCCGRTRQRGRYYQLRFTDTNRRLPAYIQEGQRAHVLLARISGENHAILEEV